MKIQLHGERVRSIRKALNLSVPQFATVVAVHPGTVHRWESAAGPVSIDGVAAGVLSALDQRVAGDAKADSDFQPDEVGRKVVRALVLGGALVALGLLIEELVGDGDR